MKLSTLEMSQQLKDQGFTSLQAEGITEQLMETVQSSDWVTKDFLRAEMRAEMAELETKLTDKMAGQKTELLGKIESTKTDLIKWMIGLQVSTVGLIFTLCSLMSGLIYFLLTDVTHF